MNNILPYAKLHIPSLPALKQIKAFWFVKLKDSLTKVGTRPVDTSHNTPLNFKSGQSFI